MVDCGITAHYTIDKMFIILKMNKLTGIFVLVLTIFFSVGSDLQPKLQMQL